MTSNQGSTNASRDVCLSDLPAAADGAPSPVAGTATAAAMPAHLAAKVNQRHIQRRAVVYVRQSTPHQVREDRKSVV